MTEEQCNLPCQKRGIECTDDTYCKRGNKMTEEATIDVYGCFFYRGIGVKFCKYYPKGCSSCGELIKTGEEKYDRKNKR